MKAIHSYVLLVLGGWSQFDPRLSLRFSGCPTFNFFIHTSVSAINSIQSQACFFWLIPTPSLRLKTVTAIVGFTLRLNIRLFRDRFAANPIARAVQELEILRCDYTPSSLALINWSASRGWKISILSTTLFHIQVIIHLMMALIQADSYFISSI